MIEGSYDGHDSEMVMIASLGSARYETVWKDMTSLEMTYPTRKVKVILVWTPTLNARQGLRLFI